MAFLFMGAGIAGMVIGVFKLINPKNVPLQDRKRGLKMLLASLGILLVGLWIWK